MREREKTIAFSSLRHLMPSIEESLQPNQSSSEIGRTSGQEKRGSSRTHDHVCVCVFHVWLCQPTDWRVASVQAPDCTGLSIFLFSAAGKCTRPHAPAPHTCHPTALIIFPLYQQELQPKHFTAADVRATRSGSRTSWRNKTNERQTTTQHKPSSFPSNQGRTLVWFFPLIKKHRQKPQRKKDNSYVLPPSVITFRSRVRPTLRQTNHHRLRQTNHSRLRGGTHVELMWTHFPCRILGDGGGTV